MAILAKGSDYFGSDGFPVTVRRVRTEPGGRPSHAYDVTELDHFHDFIELVIVLEGRGTHLLGGQPFPVSAGDVFVIQGQQVHSFRERDGLVLLNIMYDPERLPLPAGLLRRLPGYSALFLLEPNFRGSHDFSSRLRLDRVMLGAAVGLGERIAEESARAAPGHEAMLLSLLTDLMVFLSRRYDESDTRESKALLQMGKLISTLERSYAEPWDLARMATFARLSRASLLRVFRQATGRPPIGYLIELRIEAAKRLLRQGDLEITEIAQEAGFNDGNYFARQFRLVVGCTPSDFRRRARAGVPAW
jgi:AraC-like DNA-binding protein/mannose-6-phosphate isomerase-like protein (cupin superfamily)